MADTATPNPTTTPTAPATPASSSASDSALFGKFTAAHQKAVADELAKDGHGKTSNDARGRDAGVAAPGAATGGHAGVRPSGEDAGAERDDGRKTDDAGAAAPEAKPDDAPATLSETDAIALLRSARDAGDTAGIDRALKALMPGSKGLDEFNVDGKRYGEFRAASNKRAKKLDEREAQLGTREQNLQRGMSTLEQVVRRLEPIEQLVLAAQDESDAGIEAFVTLLQKATNKPINETLKRHLDRKLQKPGDPEVEALKRELKSEREAREARDRKEQDERAQQARTQEIRSHLAFLDETLTQSTDERVRTLVKSRDGITAIFRAQQAHYNPQTRTTITPEQAAKLVLAQKEVLAGGSAPAAAPATNVERKSEVTPAPASADRARSLGSRGAAPASPGAQRLTDAELFEKYERLAKIAGD